MRKLLTTIAAVAAITTAAYARIGETKQEAVQRYGQPTSAGVEDNEDWALFSKGPFIIHAVFYQGKIEQIEYIKLRPNGDTDRLDSIELSETEVTNFLKVNHVGEWKNIGNKTWKVSNLVARSNYITSHDGDWNNAYYRLLILTLDAVHRFNDNLATKETAAQAGF